MGNISKGPDGSIPPQVKAILPVLLAVIKNNDILDREIQRERLMVKVLEQSTLLDKIFIAHSHLPALPPAASANAQQVVAAMNQMVAALANMFHEEGKALFHITIKSHVLLHIAQDSSRVNPLKTWCFAAEDFLQKVRLLVQHSSHGSSPIHIQNVVMTKYVRGLCMSLWPNIPVLQ